MSDSYDNLFTPEEASRRVVVIASNNDHKVAEIRDILSDVLPGMDFKPMREIGGFPVPEETGSTFEENAFIKAEAIHNLTMMPVIADDSGLMVDALDGAPGVHSARYAGVHGDDAANNAKLLEAMKDVADIDRTARFVCSLAFVSNQISTSSIGFCEGRIGREPHGENGFGYDPLFWPDDAPGKTMAELTEEQKNAISHRRHAAEELAEKLRKLQAQGSKE